MSNKKKDPSTKKRKKVAAQPPPLRDEAISLKLVLEYDGACFFGCQLQIGQRTVQGEVERAVGRLTGEIREDGSSTVRLLLASRTDKGVHAMGQVGLIRTKSPLAENPREFKRRLNGYLPDDLVVVSAVALHPDDPFEPRADAKGKWYRYTIVSGSARPVLSRGAAWYVPTKKDKTKQLASSSNLNMGGGGNDIQNFLLNNGGGGGGGGGGGSGGGVAGGGGLAASGPNGHNYDDVLLNVVEMRKAASHLVGRPIDFSSFTNVVKASKSSSGGASETKSSEDNKSKKKAKITFQEKVNYETSSFVAGDEEGQQLGSLVKLVDNEEHDKDVEYDDKSDQNSMYDTASQNDESGFRSDSSMNTQISGFDSCYNSGAESDSGFIGLSTSSSSSTNSTPYSVPTSNSLSSSAMLALLNNAINMDGETGAGETTRVFSSSEDSLPTTTSPPPPRDPVCCITSIDISVVPSIPNYRYQHDDDDFDVVDSTLDNSGHPAPSPHYHPSSQTGNSSLLHDSYNEGLPQPGGDPAFTYALRGKGNSDACGMMVHIDIRGSRFLYNMVRVIVGTLVEVGLGRLSANDMPRIIEAKDRRAAGPGAPAKGLCLMEIVYE